MTEPTVHVIGASGRSGAALCRALLARGTRVVPVVRDAGRWAASGIALAPRVADLAAPDALARALGDAERIASTAHARHTGAILRASGHASGHATLVLLGSTRKFTRYPDAHGDGVIAGEAALLASGRAGVMLHPTMIYGAQGEDNVQRLAALLRLLPVVPLPDGGRALVQPIHQDDVTRCLRHALAATWDGPDALVIAGAAPVSYAGFVRTVARHAGLRPPRIVAVPSAVLRLTVRPLALVPRLPRVAPDEIRRLTEDKAFDIAPMRTLLRVEPRSLDEGLAGLFGRPAQPGR